ncbi:MAG: GntR family transcriptional regulator [Oscillospiraceae bacterium]|nr:GntR family transcriptional regulator [Oscillospiraceae bacterium]
MLLLKPNSRKPIYEQLVDGFGKMILTGVLKENEQLQSVRAVARDLGINPNTVQKAYQELERRHLIYSVSGKGSFVSPLDDGVEKASQTAKDDLKKAVLACKISRLSQDEVLNIVKAVFEKGE